LSLPGEIVEITLRSLYISLSAALLASLWSIPITIYASYRGGRASKAYISVMNTLMGFPTVLIGLLLYIIFSRSGPLGILRLLYTPEAMIIGQAVLVTPLISSMVYEVVSKERWELVEMARSFGARGREVIELLVEENREGIIGSIVIGFQRAVGELGIALMLGGNIAGYTRVFTTAIALEIHRGRFDLAINLGIILLLIDLLLVAIIRLLGWRR